MNFTIPMNIHYPRSNIHRIVWLILTVPILMGFTFPESNRGWLSATLDISLKSLDELYKSSKSAGTTHMELYGHELPSSGDRYDYSELFDDDYHMNRYFGISRYIDLSIPGETEGKLLQDPNRKIRTDDFAYTLDDFAGVPKFTFFKIIKKSLPGSAFNLLEVETVIFWLHRKYSGDKVFMVEFVLKTEEAFKSLEKYFGEKYGEKRDDAYGRWKLLSAAQVWTHEGTSIRLIETQTFSQGWASGSMFSLVFLDIDRTENVIEYLHTLMKLAPDIKMDTKPSLTDTETKAEEHGDKILTITTFELDTLRSSFYVKKKGFYSPSVGRIHLPFYDWKWKIIEQHVIPEKYFDRFKVEKEKDYFRKVHRYFSKKAASLSSRCVRLVSNTQNFWNLPFHPRRDVHCRNLFPSVQELDDIYTKKPELYTSLMYWYSHGFGIIYPVFNMTVYNESDEDILITDIIYNVEHLDTYLPRIIDHPPLRPFIHILDIRQDGDQRLKIDETITGLIVKPKGYMTFSIQLKSKTGIGNICKISMRLVVQHKGDEKVVRDDKLNFITVLSSRPKIQEDLSE